MATPLSSFELWSRTLGPQEDAYENSREKLRQSFLSFRERVAQLVSTLGAELPGLTVHDITHIDALWRVANQIAGPDYPLNPAEAYVLGGAFLLHDSAHVLAAYPRGVDQLKETLHWQDLISQRYAGIQPPRHSAEEKLALFQVLRHLHAEQAHVLAKLSWSSPESSDPLYLIENNELRNYYADLIGEIASSHHWSPDETASRFRDRQVPCPAFLCVDAWEVDALKIAFLLRTADAAHLDDLRAPWFLFALRQPQGVSATHWRFQAKLGQPKRTDSGELRLGSGSPFTPTERDAWWMAYDVAKMVDRELRAAHDILKEEDRPEFAAHAVLGVDSPKAFARQVPVRDWEPIDASLKVGNLPQLISRLGGVALYGDNKTAPLRELMQNALDAVRALRALGGLEASEGEVRVTIERADNNEWILAITDDGIGMSRHVLTNVLMDFGDSLWASDTMREELPGLAKSGFEPVGKFGIGFFSIFMLGSEVKVTTRRYLPSSKFDSVHWQLNFDSGLSSRPALMKPAASDQLSKPGTRVAVRISTQTLRQLLGSAPRKDPADAFVDRVLEDISSIFPGAQPKKESTDGELASMLARLITRLCPASPVRILSKFGDHPSHLLVTPNDWTTIGDDRVLARSDCNQSVIFPLTNSRGEIIGRIGLPSDKYSSGSASLVFHGILAGKSNGLAGIILASSNNVDARREKTSLGGDLSAWRRWAEGLLKTDAPMSLKQRLRLHPVVPDLDLKVWRWRGEELTLEDLVKKIEAVASIVIHDGNIEHEDYDELSSDTFNRGFSIADNVICIPSLVPGNEWGDVFFDRTKATRPTVFPWALNVAPINYRDKLSAALEASGLDFQEEFDDLCLVGYVNSTEIYRSAEVHSRVR